MDHSSHEHSHHQQQPEQSSHGHAHQQHQNHAAQNGHTGHMQHEHTHGAHDHHDHHAMMIDDFKKRFWVSVLLSIPVLLLSKMIQHWLGFTLTFPGSNYVLLGLSTIVFLYGGWPFLTGLVAELKKKSPGMMTLIALAICVAYFFSLAVVFGFPGDDFFWELATLIDIMLLGHWLEMKSVMGASRSLELLINLMPATAHKLEGEKVHDIKLEDLRPDDLLLVKPGEKIPADGIIEQGKTDVNESMLTGESKPVEKSKGDKVIGGSINGNGSVQVKVLNAGKDGYLQKVIGMVQEAQQTKSKTQHLADRAAGWLTFIALGAGITTLIVWLALGYGWNFAIERTVTVMIISCPHALGLAIPLVVAISTAVSAQNGLLIRNRTAFENTRKLTALVFDKTGTLTKGNFAVTRVESTGEKGQKEILAIAAALEGSSEHPIATGIVKKAAADNSKSYEVSDFKAITGKGITGRVDGKQYAIVSPGYLQENKIRIPENAGKESPETIVFLLEDEKLVGYIALADEIRSTSKAALKQLKANGIKVMMATGDNESVARSVAEELELDAYYAGVLPDKKVALIKDLKQKGEFVGMTGDGVNDAPALATADIGIAVGSGTDVAAETADIVLVNSDPKDILHLILFGKATYKKMIQNLIWATAYNALSIPLAAGVLYSTGFVLDPAIGAVLMSLSTIIVAANAQLLKRSLKKE